MVGVDHCPVCGTDLPSDPATEGLCPQCLLSLALVDLERSEPRRVEELPTLHRAGDGVSPGQILGERYQIRALLGRGGMGQVWRAFDLKLRVEVALKALRPELVAKERAREPSVTEPSMSGKRRHVRIEKGENAGSVSA